MNPNRELGPKSPGSCRGALEGRACGLEPEAPASRGTGAELCSGDSKSSGPLDPVVRNTLPLLFSCLLKVMPNLGVGLLSLQAPIPSAAPGVPPPSSLPTLLPLLPTPHPEGCGRLFQLIARSVCKSLHHTLQVPQDRAVHFVLGNRPHYTPPNPHSLSVTLAGWTPDSGSP